MSDSVEHRVLHATIAGCPYTVTLSKDKQGFETGAVTSNAARPQEAIALLLTSLIENLLVRHAQNGVDIEAEGYGKGFTEALEDVDGDIREYANQFR